MFLAGRSFPKIHPLLWGESAVIFEVGDENGDDDELETYSVRDLYDSHTMDWMGREVKYVGIVLEATEITPWARPGNDVMMKQSMKFDDLRHNVTHIAYKACGSEVFMTDLMEKLIFMNIQAIYRASSIRGALIGVVIAL